MFPRVSNLDLIVAISNTILNCKGTTASLCLNPLFTLNTEDKCLPILTLVYNTLFKILHNLTIWGGREFLVYEFDSIFPFSLQCYMLLENQ